MDSADAIFTGESSRDNAQNPSWIGDLDQDGRAELAIGAPGYDDGFAKGAGAVYILYGSLPTGSVSLFLADAILVGDSFGAAAGSTLAAGGQVSDDGYPDLLIGAHGETLGDTADGVGWIIAGGP